MMGTMLSKRYFNRPTIFSSAAGTHRDRYWGTPERNGHELSGATRLHSSRRWLGRWHGAQHYVQAIRPLTKKGIRMNVKGFIIEDDEGRELVMVCKQPCAAPGKTFALRGWQRRRLVPLRCTEPELRRMVGGVLTTLHDLFVDSRVDAEGELIDGSGKLCGKFGIDESLIRLDTSNERSRRKGYS
jgi:hypothetical protein